jgi:hypothetical protein
LIVSLDMATSASRAKKILKMIGSNRFDLGSYAERLAIRAACLKLSVAGADH